MASCFGRVEASAGLGRSPGERLELGEVGPAGFLHLSCTLQRAVPPCGGLRRRPFGVPEVCCPAWTWERKHRARFFYIRRRCGGNAVTSTASLDLPTCVRRVLLRGVVVAAVVVVVVGARAAISFPAAVLQAASGASRRGLGHSEPAGETQRRRRRSEDTAAVGKTHKAWTAGRITAGRFLFIEHFLIKQVLNDTLQK